MVIGMILVAVHDNVTVIGIILLFSLLNNSGTGYVMPKVELTSCLQNTASITILNVSEGGLIYFRFEDNVYNMIPSTAGTVVHQCKFEDCNITWDDKFYVVIQRKVLYQSRYDVITWLVCNTDLNAILPVTIDLGTSVDENLTTVTYTPEVSMILYRGGERLESRSEVKLGDEIHMVIYITNDVTGYVDIRAKACYASGITLLDPCPADEDLFGVFNSSSAGYMSNTFYMFRPTNIPGGAIDVVFTCILEVCRWNCDKYECATDVNNNASTPVRRKRGAEADDEETKPASVIMGFTLTALAKWEETRIKHWKTMTDLCMPLYIIIAVASASVLFIGSSSSVYIFSYWKYLEHSEAILVLDELKELKDGQSNNVPTGEIQNSQKDNQICSMNSRMCTQFENNNNISELQTPNN